MWNGKQDISEKLKGNVLSLCIKQIYLGNMTMTKQTTKTDSTQSTDLEKMQNSECT